MFKLSNPVGRHMDCLPLDPVDSKALILSSEFNCLEEMCVAMPSVKSLFYTSSEKLDEVLSSWTTSKAIALTVDTSTPRLGRREADIKNWAEKYMAHCDNQ